MDKLYTAGHYLDGSGRMRGFAVYTGRSLDGARMTCRMKGDGGVGDGPLSKLPAGLRPADGSDCFATAKDALAAADYLNERYERLFGESRRFVARRVTEDGLEPEECIGEAYVLDTLSDEAVFYGDYFICGSEALRRNVEVLRIHDEVDAWGSNLIDPRGYLTGTEEAS